MKIKLKNLSPVRDAKGRYTGLYEWDFSPVKWIVKWMKQRINGGWLWWVGAVFYIVLITVMGWLIGLDLSWQEETAILWMWEYLPITASVITVGIASIVGVFALMLDKYTERKKKYKRIKSLRKLAQRRIALRCGVTGKVIEQPTARQFVKERLRQ